MPPNTGGGEGFGACDSAILKTNGAQGPSDLAFVHKVLDKYLVPKSKLLVPESKLEGGVHNNLYRFGTQCAKRAP